MDHYDRMLEFRRKSKWAMETYLNKTTKEKEKEQKQELKSKSKILFFKKSVNILDSKYEKKRQEPYK